MASLTALLGKYKDDMTSINRISSGVVAGKVVSGTPVDQSDLQNSWTPNIGSPLAVNVSVSEGDSHRHDITSVVNALQPGDQFFFMNGQPYARRIEYEGHSPQAPHGMVGVATAEWQQIVDGAARGV